MKLCDFGLARKMTAVASDGVTPVYHEGERIHLPPASAPEVMDEGIASEMSDVWLFGFVVSVCVCVCVCDE